MTKPKRPPIGSHVRITEHYNRDGIRHPYDVVYEGIVAPKDDQPPNPQMVALKPVDHDRAAVNVFFGPADTGGVLSVRTLEVIGWPVGMIALWSAYDPNHLRDVFTDEPFRWDGEAWVPVDYQSGLMVHDGQVYPLSPPAGADERPLAPKMGATIWDGVVPR